MPAAITKAAMPTGPVNTTASTVPSPATIGPRAAKPAANPASAGPIVMIAAMAGASAIKAAASPATTRTAACTG